MHMGGGEARRWLVVDTSKDKVMRFATATPSDRPRIEDIKEIDIDGLPTFTDALQKYARESGNRLSDLDCVLCMAGAVSGEMIHLSRSNWTITRGGLSAVFNSKVRIINDVVARGWAMRAGMAQVSPLRGSGQPSLSQPGRMLKLLVADGVGAAIVDVNRDGKPRILETESGHMDFAPANEREEKLAKAIKGNEPTVSWEKVLTLPAEDPIWQQALPELVGADREKLQAGILGRMVVNLMHAHGAWQGVMLAGQRARKLTEGSNRLGFDGAFIQRRTFTRLVSNCPVWWVDGREPVLTGGAELMAHRAEEKRGNVRAAA